MWVYHFVYYSADKDTAIEPIRIQSEESLQSKKEWNERRSKYFGLDSILWKQIMKLQVIRKDQEMAYFYWAGSSISHFLLGVCLYPKSFRCGKVNIHKTIATVTKLVKRKKDPKILNVFQSLFRVDRFSPSLSLLFTMTDIKHYIQIGSGRCKRSLHLLWESYTLRRLIVRGGTENCAVMVENATRLIWVHFAAIISLSLSSNKHWRKKKRRCSTAQPEMWVWHYVDNSVCGYCSDRHRHINASHYCL